jgi:hypothetical protein
VILTGAAGWLDHGPMRRRTRIALASLAVAAVGLFVAPAVAAGEGAGDAAAVAAGDGLAAWAGDGDGGAPGGDGRDGAPSDDEPVPAEDIIPSPNSGRAPEDAGDRGGALQGAVLLLIVVAVGGIVAMIVRESRRNRAQRS